MHIAAAPPSPSSTSLASGCASNAISLLHEAETQAAALVLAAREAAVGLRQRAAAEAAEEGKQLQQEMKNKLEAIEQQVSSSNTRQSKEIKLCALMQEELFYYFIYIFFILNIQIYNHIYLFKYNIQRLP